MPVNITFESNKQGVLIKAHGTVDGKEFLGKMRELFTDQETTRNYRYALNDFTQIKQYNISTIEIYSLANLHLMASEVNREIMVGFAIWNPLVYGLVRMWMAYAASTGWQIGIRKTYPEIRDWLNETLQYNSGVRCNELLGI